MPPACALTLIYQLCLFCSCSPTCRLLTVSFSRKWRRTRAGSSIRQFQRICWATALTEETLKEIFLLASTVCDKIPSTGLIFREESHTLERNLKNVDANAFFANSLMIQRREICQYMYFLCLVRFCTIYPFYFNIIYCTPTSHAILSHLPVLHEVHYRQDCSTDACWEDGLGRL